MSHHLVSITIQFVICESFLPVPCFKNSVGTSIAAGLHDKPIPIHSAM